MNGPAACNGLVLIRGMKARRPYMLTDRLLVKFSSRACRIGPVRNFLIRSTHSYCRPDERCTITTRRPRLDVILVLLQNSERTSSKFTNAMRKNSGSSRTRRSKWFRDEAKSKRPFGCHPVFVQVVPGCQCISQKLEPTC